MEKIKAAVNIVLSKYATFSGRASRSEFWWWVLAVFLANLAASALDTLIFGTGSDNSQPVGALLNLALFLPNIAVGARRLHDIGKSGWWLLIALIPVVGFLVLLYFYVQPSDPDANAYGAPEPFPIQ
jgi:uncharacterized membrane protein YhaH (DUF805 family)